MQTQNREEWPLSLLLLDFHYIWSYFSTRLDQVFVLNQVGRLMSSLYSLNNIERSE